MAHGETEEAKKYLLATIVNDTREHGAYYGLSKILETAEEAEDLLKSINSTKAWQATPQRRLLIEFAISNCLHKTRNYGEAARHLALVNKNKLIVYPSNAYPLMQAIKRSLAYHEPKEDRSVNAKSGKERIFIVGMPRSGSTLLETILSLNPEIKDLGESRSLEKTIALAKEQKGNNANYHNINSLYSQFIAIDSTRYKYTTDKQLYNFIYTNYITTYMPGAKIIHCRRNPMDNILSMYRSNLTAGNNYTADLEDAARVLTAQEQAMQIHKQRHPSKIFTFDYDKFVNAPEVNLRKLLKWLDIEFNEYYLYPEKSKRRINTASVIQARKPISNKSVNGWRNYESHSRLSQKFQKKAD